MALIMREFTTKQRLIDIMRRCFACVELCVMTVQSRFAETRFAETLTLTRLNPNPDPKP